VAEFLEGRKEQLSPESRAMMDKPGFRFLKGLYGLLRAPSLKDLREGKVTPEEFAVGNIPGAGMIKASGVPKFLARASKAGVEPRRIGEIATQMLYTDPMDWRRVRDVLMRGSTRSVASVEPWAKPRMYFNPEAAHHWKPQIWWHELSHARMATPPPWEAKTARQMKALDELLREYFMRIRERGEVGRLRRFKYEGLPGESVANTVADEVMRRRLETRGAEFGKVHKGGMENLARLYKGKRFMSGLGYEELLEVAKDLGISSTSPQQLLSSIHESFKGIK